VILIFFAIALPMNIMRSLGIDPDQLEA